MSIPCLILGANLGCCKLVGLELGLCYVHILPENCEGKAARGILSSFFTSSKERREKVSAVALVLCLICLLDPYYHHAIIQVFEGEDAGSYCT